MRLGPSRAPTGVPTAGAPRTSRTKALMTGAGLPRTRPETARYARAAYQFRLDFFNEDTDFGGFSRSRLGSRRRDRRGAGGPRWPTRRQLPDRPAERSAEKPRLPA